MSSIHPDICDRLLSYLDGRLDENQRRHVQVHLESCESCSEELAAMRAITRALRQTGLDELTATADVERYGCPGADALTLYETQEASHPKAEGEWIARHLETCLRCQHEIDMIRLMALQLSEPSGIVTPQDLSAQVEERLMARVRQGIDADHRTAVQSRFPSLSPSCLWRTALGIAFAAGIAAWGIIQFERGPVLVVQRSSDQGVRTVQLPPSSPAPQEQPPSSSSSVVPKVEAPAMPSLQPNLPPLIPAKQGEVLKLLILPTPIRQELRSAVAAGLRDRFETVQPPDREFPPEPSVDDLTANRRLGRLFGVRYILEIDVKKQPSGYLVMLRAADTETGGVVAKRGEQTLEEGALTAVAGRLARELQQELLARP